MNRIDVKIGKNEYTFRTNDNGFNLFIGDGENRQISHESGFNSLKRIKKAIRQYLECEHSCLSNEKLPRISYSVKNGDWKK